MESNKEVAVAVAEGAVQLNADILSEILSRLRVKDLIRFKSICKEWLHLITSQEFIKLHLKKSCFRAIPLEEHYSIGCPHLCPPQNSLNRSLFPDNSNMLLTGGSCDGLVCLFNQICGIIHIWNPALRSSSCIPINNPDYIIVCVWFGRHNGEYKLVVVTAADHHPWPWPSQVHLLSPYGGPHISYKSIQEVKKQYIFYSKDLGTLCHGNVHWAVDKWIESARCYCTILSYDLTEETVGEIPIPVIDEFVASFEIGVINGYLSVLLRAGNLFSETKYELWAMKEYGVEESWTRLEVLTEASLSALRAKQLRGEMEDPSIMASPLYPKEAYVETLVSPTLETQGARCHSPLC